MTTDALLYGDAHKANPAPLGDAEHYRVHDVTPEGRVVYKRVEHVVREPAPRRGPGAVIVFDPAIAARICELVSIDVSVIRACDENPDFPCPTTVFSWLSVSEEFRELYREALSKRADFLADDMARLERLAESGSIDPKAAQVVISSKQWRAAKLNPKRYSERQVIDHTVEVKLTADVAMVKLAGLLGRLDTLARAPLPLVERIG